MPVIIIFPILFFIFIIILSIFFYQKYRKKSKYLLQDQTNLIPKNATFEYLQVRSNKKSYKEYNSYLSEVLSRNNVGSIYLLHGTFVGDDPFHIIDLISEVFPHLGQEIIQSIKNKTKLTQNIFAKDLGNFVDEHIKYIDQMTGHKFRVRNITWSSGNNHLARIKGAISLIESLSEEVDERRVLLIGHSHAGQLFSIMTQFLNNPLLVKSLRKILPSTIDLSDLEKKLKKIQSFRLDFVTMGTPQRYEWKLNDKINLLHFINHRGKSVLGGDFIGAIRTLDGDYIQQWGISGSDIVSPIKEEQKINTELDEIFGVGSNLEFLKQNITFRKRLHSEGHHLLVDYQDSSKYPNFLLTIFGHGRYTKYEYLDFHFEEICKRLYI